MNFTRDEIAEELGGFHQFRGRETGPGFWHRSGASVTVRIGLTLGGHPGWLSQARLQ